MTCLMLSLAIFCLFFFNDTATTEIYTLSLHDALPISREHEIARAYRASEELLREKKRVSLGSLIPSAVALLETDAALRESLQQRFRYILVDERSEEHTSELQSQSNLVCRLLLEKTNDHALHQGTTRTQSGAAGVEQILLVYLVLAIQKCDGSCATLQRRRDSVQLIEISLHPYITT